jgi:hypothetical protein
LQEQRSAAGRGERAVGGHCLEVLMDVGPVASKQRALDGAPDAGAVDGDQPAASDAAAAVNLLRDAGDVDSGFRDDQDAGIEHRRAADELLAASCRGRIADELEDIRRLPVRHHASG